MDNLRLIIALMVGILAIYIVAMNWGCIIVSLNNKKKGIDRHHSTVPLISLLLSAFAALIYPYDHKKWFLLIALCDLSNWSLLCLPIIFIKYKLGSKSK